MPVTATGHPNVSGLIPIKQAEDTPAFPAMMETNLDRAMPAVITPTLGVDPGSLLQCRCRLLRGAYALLVGSGMSSAAGIPTGWQVVQDLIRKTARAEGLLVGEDHQGVAGV